MRSFALSCLLVLVWAPEDAAAATVTFGPEDAVVVVAEPGEVNRIRVTADPSAVEVSDAGAPARAGTGCSLVGPSVVRCQAASALLVDVGDGDDRVEIVGDALRVATLVGGPGDDELSDDGTRGDVIDGGPGVDIVDYSARTARVTVRLDRLGGDDRAGEAGEGDRLTAVEGAWGGDGDDLLRAGDRGASPSTVDRSVAVVPGLAGGRGDDVLIGGRGDDTIDASEDADRVRSGPGDDEVILESRRRGARVDCGPGFDLVGSAAPSDALARNCNLIYATEYGNAFTPAGVWSGGIRVRQIEPRTRVSVVVDGGRLDGRLIARRSFRSRRGRLHLTALGRRLARRGQLPAIRVTCRAGRRAAREGFRLQGRMRSGLRRVMKLGEPSSPLSQRRRATIRQRPGPISPASGVQRRVKRPLSRTRVKPISTAFWSDSRRSRTRR